MIKSKEALETTQARGEGWGGRVVWVWMTTLGGV